VCAVVGGDGTAYEPSARRSRREGVKPKSFTNASARGSRFVIFQGRKIANISRGGTTVPFDVVVFELDLTDGVPRAVQSQLSMSAGSVVLYFTCLRAKLERILATPRVFESRSTMKCWSATASRTSTRKR
jgi:hypothetical protein